MIIPGYVVEGTLGKVCPRPGLFVLKCQFLHDDGLSQQILSQPDEIVSMSGAKLPLRLSVEYISFSAHVDYRENSAFIEEVGAPNLVAMN